MPNGVAERNRRTVRRDLQDLRCLRLTEREDRAIRQRAETWWHHSILRLLAQNGNLYAPVIVRHEDASLYGHSDNDWRIGAQTVWLGEWAFDDDTEIAPAVRTLNADERLSGQPLDIAGR